MAIQVAAVVAKMAVEAVGAAVAAGVVEAAASGWGLHSSTFWLNVSAFCGMGGALRGCLGGV